MSEKYLYIETDGQVYLIERDGLKTIPRRGDSLPFEIEEKVEMFVADRSVSFCVPLIEYHPKEWLNKDEIPIREDIDPFVRQVIHTTMPRVVSEALIVRDDQIVLVKATRGFNKGNWSLPGGFVSYGEEPKVAVEREVLEEVGAKSRVEELCGVDSYVGIGSYITWHMFSFRVTLLEDKFDPDPSEIEEVRWFPIEEALGVLHKSKQRLIEKYVLDRQ
jgi:ADP-ribose pyrophosphatase YjhB (NUDIX family)